MKLLVAGIVLALGLAGGPAAAEHERRGGFGFRPDFRVQQAPPARFKGDPGRDSRRDRQAQPRERPRERLTEEERRELRRDIDRANRELYRRRPERR
jgi:hypothetical protein